ITLENLCAEIVPSRTALLFGAGSSIPSGALTGAQLAAAISQKFQIGLGSNLSLADIASLVEIKRSRRELVDYLRALIFPLKPSGGILDIPRYPWREIFTTNYDNIVERSYANLGVQYKVISANY